MSTSVRGVTSRPNVRAPMWLGKLLDGSGKALHYDSISRTEQRLYGAERIEPHALSSLCPRWSVGSTNIV